MDDSRKEKIVHDIKAVVFDFDGTLALLNIDFILMKERVFEMIGQLGIPVASLKERYVLEIIEEVYGMVSQRSAHAADRFHQGAHEILQQIELEAARRGKLIFGVEEGLQSLRKKGIKVGIVTRNCELAVRTVFPNIHEFCDVFASRNSVKRVKPHPDHLTFVMEALRVLGDEVMVVGDHVLDILAGKRVGATTVGVLTGRTRRKEFEEAGADLVLNEAQEVWDLFSNFSPCIIPP